MLPPQRNSRRISRPFDDTKDFSVDIQGVIRYKRDKYQHKVKNNLAKSQDFNQRTKTILPSLILDQSLCIEHENKELILKPLDKHYEDLLNPRISNDEKGLMCLMQKKSEVIQNKKNSTKKNRQVKKTKKENLSEFLHPIPRVGNFGYNQISKTSDSCHEYCRSGNYCLQVESKPLVKAEHVEELANFVQRITNFGTEIVQLSDIKTCLEFCDHIYQYQELKYLLKNNLIPESQTTTSLIMKIIDVETETHANQGIIKEWIKPMQQDNMIRQRLLLFIRDSSSKDSQGVRDIILEIDREKNGFLFMVDVFKQFDDDFQNKWFISNQSKVLEVQGTAGVHGYARLSIEEKLQFICFRDFITIFQKFREDTAHFVDVAINELKSFQDFEEGSEIAVFNHKDGVISNKIEN